MTKQEEAHAKHTGKAAIHADDVQELTADLQRVRADFENYRKRVDGEKAAARAYGRSGAIMQLLPIIDTIERATTQVPEDIRKNAWVQGIVGLSKNLDKAITGLGLKRIDASIGHPFDPTLHEAVQVDDSDGDTEVVAEELQAGYTLDGNVLRHSMVKVTHQ